MRLIDVEQFCKDNPNFDSAVYVALSKAPTIEAEPVRHGKWIAGTYTYLCSECGQRTKHTAAKFCPECGAKMDGGTK